MINMYHQQLFFREAKKIIGEKRAGYYTLACVNIDNFRVINEQYGVGVGDAVLKHLAECIDECVVNLGGICGHAMADEFLLLYPTELSGTERMEKYYLKASMPPCLERKIGLRIGKYCIENPHETLDTMYNRAQIAAESIRGDYERNRAQYSEDMRLALLYKQQLIFDMTDALEKKEFEIWLQPQYNHATDEIIGAEALVRWKRNENYVSPAEFIRVFEENGFIYRMDKFVWEGVCKLLRKWIDEGRELFPLSVNISRKDILHDDFIDTFTSLVEKYAIPVELLCVEITESAFADSERKVITRANELARRGYTVEIDDFGSGYSSLNTLKDVSASVLKLDMRFFENTENADRAGNIIESVIRLARWLDMTVIAEGVEERAQVDFLKSIGCRYVQGYYYARPMPIAEFEAWTENYKKEKKTDKLVSLEHFENSEFWNPKSMETLIFNSYVGGAYIFEYYNGNAEVLRINDGYIKQFRGILSPGTDLRKAGILPHLSETEKKKFHDTVRKAIESRQDASCELTVSDGKRTEYLRTAMRALAHTQGRYLFYAVIANVTEKNIIRRNEQVVSRQLQEILNNIQEGVIATIFKNKDDIQVVYANDSFYRLHGYTREQFENEVAFINDLILPEDRAFAEDTVAGIIRERKSTAYEYRCIKRDGNIVRLHMTNSVIALEGVGDNVLLGVLSEVTDETGDSQK